MTPSNNNSIQMTVRQLKEIIVNLRGPEHEAFKLVSQMESLVMEIETKARKTGHSLGSTQSSAASKISNV